MLRDVLSRTGTSTRANLEANLPLEPIQDHDTYARAIAVLDRMFHLKREKNREESAYFCMLAQLAHEYECVNFDDGE